VGCLLAFALPFLSLSFGQAPSQSAMDAAGRLLEPHLPNLRPWEVSVLAWGAARLGYVPTPSIARRLQERVAEILRRPPSSPRAFTPQVCIWEEGRRGGGAQTPLQPPAQLGLQPAAAVSAHQHDMHFVSIM
jgi:hypothetical protein